MGQYYSLEYANLWLSVKETAFRTNANGKDTSNLNTDSFRRFPIDFKGMVKPRPLSYRTTKTRSAGKGLDYSAVYQDGYEPIKFTLTGDVLDFAFMYQLCGCTTAGSYTHTYASGTTQVQASFQMLQRIKNIGTWLATKLGFTNEAIASGQGTTTVTMTSNTTIAINAFAGYICTINDVDYKIISNTATTGASAVTFTVDHAIGAGDNSETLYMSESRFLLYTGCKITEFVATWKEKEGRIVGKLTIECANSFASTPLTTLPDWFDATPYYFNPLTGFTWTGYTGPHTYTGFCSRWRFRFNNGQHIRTINYLVLPDRIIENYRTIELDWDWVTEEMDDWSDSQKNPITDLDQDLTHTLSNGTDTMVMSWAKMLVEYLGSEYNYKDFYLLNKYKASLNPAQTSTFTMVETNSADNTYYEG